MYNYNFLLRIEYKTSILSLVISGLFFIILCLSFFLQTYTSYYVRGIYQDYLIIEVPIENSDAVNKGEYLVIDDKIYSYKIAKTSELKNSNYINYQEYYINIDQIFRENEIVEITFYYNKQRMIQKIIDIIF